MFGPQRILQLSLDESPYLLSLYEDFFTNDQTAKRSGHGRILMYILSFPGGSDGKEPAYKAGDLGLIPGLGRSPGEGNVNPFQYSCLENSVDRGVHRVTKSPTQLKD